MKAPWVSPELVPRAFDTPRIHLEPLTIHHVLKDYEAVMTSGEHLRATFSFAPGDSWPAADLSLTQDMVDCAWHGKEFELGTSFSYTVESPDKSRCLGCV